MRQSRRVFSFIAHRTRPPKSLPHLQSFHAISGHYNLTIIPTHHYTPLGPLFRKMSLFPPQFQIYSDLHLETPLTSPTYGHFSRPENLPMHASNLFLLGDIGCVRDDGLFAFLRLLLARTPNLKVYYVLGNHEAYGMSLEQTKKRLLGFEVEMRREYGERFWFMDKRRVDVSPTLTILGCTLWSHISYASEVICTRLLTDFNEYAGITGRTVEDHNADHATDLAWLNEQFEEIETFEPGREIIVLTHHCPTKDARACDPKHLESNVREGFTSFLQQEQCWRSKNTKVWAFGHTHYNCRYLEQREGDGAGEGVLVVANQKGYCGMKGEGNWNAEKCVLEKSAEGWTILRDVGGRDKEVKVEGQPVLQEPVSEQGKAEKKSLFSRAEGKIKKKLGFK